MKTISIEHRITKTSIATWICTIINMIIQLITVPICLHYWGSSLYGTWLAVLAAFSLMRTIDYGYMIYTGNEMNILYHTNDQQLRVKLASSIWGIITLGILQLIFLIILYLSNRMGLIMGVHSNNYYNYEVFLSLLFMSICWICFCSYIAVVHRMLIPLGMLYQLIWMMLWLQVAEFIVIVIAAFMKLNILDTTILFSLIMVIFYISSGIYIRSILPQYFPWWKNSNIKIGILNIFNSIPITLGWAMTQATISTPILLISAFLTPAAVPAFTALRTISNLWVTIINSFTSPMVPEGIRFRANGQLKKLSALNDIHWILINVIINLSILITYPFINIIFNLWTGYHLFFNKPLLNLLLATIIVFGMGAFMGAFMNNINISKYIMTSSIMRGGITLLISWILIPLYGSLGIGIGLLIAEIIVLILTIFWFFNQIIDKMDDKVILDIWPWISSLAIVIFLISQCFYHKYYQVLYVSVFAITIFSIIFSWQLLDIEIKIRIKSLIWQHFKRHV